MTTYPAPLAVPVGLGKFYVCNFINRETGEVTPRVGFYVNEHGPSPVGSPDPRDGENIPPDQLPFFLVLDVVHEDGIEVIIRALRLAGEACRRLREVSSDATD